MAAESKPTVNFTPRAGQPPTESSKPPTLVPEPAEDEGSNRGMDPELRTMGRMVRLLDEIDEPARARVVRWLVGRYAKDGVV